MAIGYPNSLSSKLDFFATLLQRNIGYYLHISNQPLNTSNYNFILVEDPTDDFRRIRDFVDCKRCLTNNEVMETIRKTKCNGSAENNASQSKPNYILFRERVRKHLKISRCQAKRVFEILQLFLLPRTEEATELYRKALHKRISKFYEVSLFFDT